MSTEEEKNDKNETNELLIESVQKFDGTTDQRHWTTYAYFELD